MERASRYTQFFRIEEELGKTARCAIRSVS
ncbi:hypothetical protein DRO66_05470 [Candidatus Bathyarchaeota archaeon]|nr:MAG: hypothetical protein DRO66_05470 [Candidatus Bathyarchaeota archaeon]